MSNVTAGIYARKSLFTGKGESVQNQINMGIEYCNAKGWRYEIYTDEGYSGKDTDRPDFQRMCQDIEKGKLNNVIFYRLDRISRRILDICEFIESLDRTNVGFISLTESFDTTSPMGRAMVHIAATFAQLEREMLAQRVKDNMMQLAKTGRWLGGVTPTGYRSKKIEHLAENLKKKTMFILEEIPDELELVKKIYNKYLEVQSLSQLEKAFIIDGVTTKNNKAFQKMTLRAILTNPVYIKADALAYEYFSNKGIQIANPIDDFDGKHGVLTYNKNIEKKGRTNQKRQESEWIMAVSKHKGIIDSAKWIQVQTLLNTNSNKAPRVGTSSTALLSGLLRCGQCGSFMRVKYGQVKKDTGKRISYYVCNNKAIAGSCRCGNSNIKTSELEAYVEKKLFEITTNNEFIDESLTAKEKNSANELKQVSEKQHLMKNTIQENEKKIENLLDQLEGESKGSPISLRIKKRIEALEEENNELKDKLLSASKNIEEINSDSVGIELFRNAVKNFRALYHETDDIEMKRNLIRPLVQRITWDDGKVAIDIIGVKKSRE